MVTSRNPSSSASSPDADPLEALTLSFSGLSPVPSSSRPASYRARGAAASSVAPPPPTSRSLPSTLQASSFRGVPGHLNGKDVLFRYGPSKEGLICRGFVGSDDSRFCCKFVASGALHCGVVSHGKAKFQMTASSYYIKMKGESALCYPFVTQSALQATNSLALVAGQHTSMEWAAILHEFLLQNVLAQPPLKPPAAAAEASVASYGSLGDLDDEDGDSVRAPGRSFFFGNDGDEGTHTGGLGGLSEHSAGRSIVGGASVIVGGASLGHSGRSLASVVHSGGSVASVAPSLSFSRSVWNTLKPRVSSPDDFSDHEDKTWYKPVLLLQQNVQGVVLSVESLIERIPVALDQLDNKAEEAFVHKSMLGLSVAVTKPFGDIRKQYSDLRGLVLGAATSTEVEQFEGKSGTFLGAISDMQVAIDQLALDVADASHAGSPADLDRRFIEFANKAAKAVRASADHAMAERIVLTDRIAALEARLDAQNPSTDPVGDVFTFALQGLTNPAIPSVSPSLPSPSALAASTDGFLGRIDGEAITLQWLVEQIRSQELIIHEQRKEINALKSSTYAKGVKVEFTIFEGVEEILSIIESEGIDPAHLAGAVDINSLLVHYPDGNDATDKNTSELKNARAAGITDAICCAYIASFRQRHPPFLLGDSGKAVPEGTRFPFLKNRVAWEGKPAMEGGRKSLLKAVKDALANCRQYIEDFIPAGKFKDLMILMANRSSEWWIALVAYIEDELITLSQFGISEDKVYTLVCDELQIMLRKMFEPRMKMLSFSGKVDSKVYLAKSVWVSMQCHMVQDEFEELGFGSHVLISSLFTRFLAEQTGNSSAASLMKKLAELKAEIDKNKTYLEGRVNVAIARADKAVSECSKPGNKAGA